MRAMVYQDDDGKNWLNPELPEHDAVITSLLALIERLKKDNDKFIHPYNTCCVERAHSERLAYTPKRVEYWKSWQGRCRLVQLIHNYGFHDSVRMLVSGFSWSYEDAVWDMIAKLDMARQKSMERKTDPQYNARKMTLEIQHKQQREDRKAVTNPSHTYRSGQPLYHHDDNTPSAPTPKKGSKKPRTKRRIEDQLTGPTGDKENIPPAPTLTPTTATPQQQSNLHIAKRVKQTVLSQMR
jgi:hypothetical protein